MHRAMLVAAGFGTRLEPLTRELPKAAVPVANRPVLGASLAHLYRYGVRDFVVNTHHLAAQLRAAVDPLVPPDARLDYSHESEILGTGGGVRRAWGTRPDAPLLVVNAKLLYEPDLARLAETHAASGALATMALRPLPEGSGFAPVDVDAEGRVLALRAEVPPPGTARRCMFTGVHLLSPALWARLPVEGCVVRDGYMRWLGEGGHVAAVVDDTPWEDVGVDVTRYGEANLSVLDGRRHLADLTPDARQCVIAPDAVVGEGVDLRRCAVGAGARVASGVSLQDCVLWPGAIAERPMRRMIVTTAGAEVPF